jgi:hypothetical protein
MLMPDIQSYELSGLYDEINFQRMFIHCLVEYGKAIDNISDMVSLVRVLSLSCLTHARLVKIQLFILESEDEISR